MQNLLHLLQLADSALPIGSVAHSYGLETMVAENYVTVDSLEDYLIQLLYNTGKQEAWGCYRGYQLGMMADSQQFDQAWSTLHHTLSALRPAQELRVASEKIGRRLLQLVGSLTPDEKLQLVWHRKQTHHGPIFGLIGATLDLDEMTILLVYLQQLIKTQVAAAQKLLPLGQTQAMQIVWHVKPMIEEIATQIDDDLPPAFPGLTEMGALRHPYLSTRLFIS
ncbi:MAG: urease accessory UreF family protein [Chloroflexota bacterium]